LDAGFDMSLLFKNTKSGWKKESSELLLSRLVEIQAQDGFCSEVRLRNLAEEMQLPLTQVYEVVTFYSFLRTHPAGHHTLMICNSPSCFVNGSEKLLQNLENYLHIKRGETSSGETISLRCTSCIGCCNEAPAALLDDLPLTKLDTQHPDQWLKESYANIKEHEI